MDGWEGQQALDTEQWETLEGSTSSSPHSHYSGPHYQGSPVPPTPSQERAPPGRLCVASPFLFSTYCHAGEGPNVTEAFFYDENGRRWFVTDEGAVVLEEQVGGWG